VVLKDASQLRQRGRRLLADVHGLEAILLGHGPLVRGSLIWRPKFCGKPGCKCSRGEPHPAGLYLSRLEQGVARPRFVRAADHDRVTREAEAYRAFRGALRRWRAIAKELNRLWEELGKAREEEYPFA
jgi:hypothetical protein